MFLLVEMAAVVFSLVSDGGKEADETVLYLQKHRIEQTENTIEIVVDSQPFDAGIDPYNKLIDRVSDDNRRQVSEE